jgi:hypothetical protein
MALESGRAVRRLAFERLLRGLITGGLRDVVTSHELVRSLYGPNLVGGGGDAIRVCGI